MCDLVENLYLQDDVVRYPVRVISVPACMNRFHHIPFGRLVGGRQGARIAMLQDNLRIHA